jgi:hypothetical protein
MKAWLKLDGNLMALPQPDGAEFLASPDERHPRFSCFISTAATVWRA